MVKRQAKVVDVGCLVIVSKVKKMGKSYGLRTGKDFIEALSEKVKRIIEDAGERVRDAGKKVTLGEEDIQV